MWKTLHDCYKKLVNKNRNVEPEPQIEDPAILKQREESLKQLQATREIIAQKVKLTYSAYHHEKALLFLELLTEVSRLDNLDSDQDKKVILDFMYSRFSSSEVNTAYAQLPTQESSTENRHFNLQDIIEKLKNRCTDQERNQLVDVCKTLVNADNTIDDKESSTYGFIRRQLYTHNLPDNTFFSTCENCGSEKFKRLNETVIHEWQAEKNINADNSDSLHKAKTVEITMVKSEIQWQCEECNHIWTTTREHEKLAEHTQH